MKLNALFVTMNTTNSTTSATLLTRSLIDCASGQLNASLSSTRTFTNILCGLQSRKWSWWIYLDCIDQHVMSRYHRIVRICVPLYTYMDSPLHLFFLSSQSSTSILSSRLPLLSSPHLHIQSYTEAFADSL